MTLNVSNVTKQLSRMDWKSKTLLSVTAVSTVLDGTAALRESAADINNMTEEQRTEYLQKQKAQQEANTYQWNDRLSIVENMKNGAETTANIVTSTVTDAADKITDHDNTIPLALCSLAGLSALALYTRTRKQDEAEILPEENIKTDEIKTNERKQKFMEEETILAGSENGVMQNGDIRKQSGFMQYAVDNLKGTGDFVSTLIQNGKGKVIIKRIGDLDIDREGFKAIKIIEKADKSKVAYDVTVLQYPDYNKTEVFFNRMFEYSPDNSDYLNPSNYCALYECKNGKTMPDGPTNHESAQNFLKKAFA